MPDTTSSLRDTRGGVDQAALYQRLFTGAVPYAEWAGRVRHGALLDVQRIDSAVRAADVGIMWPLADMAREAIALNPKAQGLVGKGLLPLANASYEIVAAQDGLSPQEREEAKRIADTVRAMVRGVRRFRQALLDLVAGFWDGRAALEAQYERRGSQSWPVALEWLIPQRLSFDERRALIVVDRWGDYGLFRRRGPALCDVPGKFIEFAPRMYADLQEREGLAPRFLFWLLFDRMGWRHRLMLSESFGMPWMFIEQEVANTIGAMKLPRLDGGEGGAPNDDGAALDYALEEAEATKREGKWVGLPGQKAKLEWPPAEVHDFFTQGTDQIMDRLSWLACHNGINDGSRAAEVILKAPEDILFEFRSSLVAEALEAGLTNVLVELNWGADALPLAPSFRLTTTPERDRDKRVERLTKVSAAVPIGVSTWYEVSGFSPPQEGEELAKPPAPVDPFAPGGGGFPADRSSPSEASSIPALPRGEGASSDGERALRELLEDADEDAQAEAADEEAMSLARAWFAAAPTGRKVQPASVNGSPELLVARGVKEATRHLEKWREVFLDAADGADGTKLYRRLTHAAKALDVEPFARALERRILHSLMLGGLDSDHEAREDVTIKPVAFSFLTFDGGVADFTTKPFGEAIKAFRSREVLPRRDFDRLAASAKKRAFTVAKLQSEEMLRTVHDELGKAIEEGTDLREFSRRLSERFDSAGWTQLNPSHVETVFRTGVMGAYNDGRKAQMSTPVMLKMRPYWQWLGVDDARTRPTHKAAIGKVLPATDPFFDRAGPPAGFNCRCRLVSRSARDLERLGLVPTIGAQLRGLPDEGWDAGGSLL